jgi:uncharacterized protein
MNEPVRHFKFEWDEAKNQANIRKHGFDFSDAEEMFEGPLLVRPDTREDYGEERWIGIGFIRRRLAFVAFTERPEGTIRVISLRRAKRAEQKEYQETIPDGLGTH